MHCFNEVAVGGAGMPAHQDDNYFKVKHQTAVTTWLSSSHADEFNGAICYIPGLHKMAYSIMATHRSWGFRWQSMIGLTMTKN